MLSSLYGNLPPPEAKKASGEAEVSSSGNGMKTVAELLASSDAAGAVEIDVADSRGDDGGNYQSNGLAGAAWSKNRAKLFVPPTLRSRQQQPPHKQSNAKSSSGAAAAGALGSSLLGGWRSGGTTIGNGEATVNETPMLSSGGVKRPQSGSTERDMGLDPPEGLNRRAVERDPRSLYDPMKPNNYEQVVRERAMKRRQAEIERQQKEELGRLREMRERAGPSSLPLNVSGEDAWRRRAALSAAPRPSDPAVDNGRDARVSPMNGVATEVPAASGKKLIAMRMMEQMGWKSGEGLGREKQGIVAPLVARKTDRKSGVIIQGREAPQGAALEAARPPTALPRNITRIVLLLNLVGRGEVDEELEEETKEEASKYGNLLGVKIREQSASAPDDEAVRVFLEYESKEHATKAFTTFSGRFFGGRVVKAKFYDEMKYATDDLNGDIED